MRSLRAGSKSAAFAWGCAVYLPSNWRCREGYQVGLASIVKDFGVPQGGGAVPPPDPEHFRGRVPDAMIEFWQQNGTGIILDQFDDPDKYAPIIKAERQLS
ncbi:GAD-like domain-containing protein [Rhizobium mongolense]|uniref:GAD-like domain-containing protein n=1 Tax=Rhizobium mongolense TaxID=57676 RepID=UPI003556B282